MKSLIISCVIAVASLSASADAATVTVTGATEIAKPASVTNGAPGSNGGTLWFLESLGSVVAANQAGLGGTAIVAGQLVDTYMIFLNRGDSTRTLLEDSASFSFSTAILGIFGQANGGDLVATDYFGGSTTYTNFNARGIENDNNGSLSATGNNNDLLTIVGTNQLDTYFKVTQPGDWVRVAVVSSVPVPAGLLLLPFGLAGLFAVGRRKQRATAA